MRMDVKELDGGVVRITLDGDLDAKGSGEIEVQFAAVTSVHTKVVVDMAKVGFLASIGIRTLLSAARTAGRRGGKVVLLSPVAPVLKVLQVSGADTLVPIFGDLDAAVAAIG